MRRPRAVSYSVLAVIVSALIFQTFALPQRYKVLHNFGGLGDGYNPSGVTFDSHGNMFGVTSYGGAGWGGLYGQYGGVVYQITP
jgi:hypothetical protein